MSAGDLPSQYASVRGRDTKCTTETQRHGEDQKAPLRASVVNIVPFSEE